jgi:hypothetical protein
MRLKKKIKQKQMKVKFTIATYKRKRLNRESTKLKFHSLKSY